MALDMATAIITDLTESTASIPINLPAKNPAPQPNRIPSIPPIKVSIIASTTNWNIISLFLAPMDFLMPISLVLSVTVTIIIFITPIPPTIREMAATPLIKRVTVPANARLLRVDVEEREKKLYKFSNEDTKHLIHDLKEEGLAGIEVYHSSHHIGQITKLRQWQKEYDLLATGGSDFHGTNKPDIEIGTGRGPLFVPDHLIDDLMNYH